MAWMSQKLRYTKNINKLTHSQRLFYEQNGYLMFPKLVPQSLLQKCNQRFNDIVSGNIPKGFITMMRDVKDKKSVNKLQDLNVDEVFLEYIEYKDILDIVESFTGSNIMAVHNMLIAKPPDSGFGTSEHPPHQDLFYFPFRPADNIVASWTAMERCDSDNGCLYAYPGTHTLDRLFSHDYPPKSKKDSVNKFYYGIYDLPEGITRTEFIMEPGDTVFFHPLLIHGSGINRSKRTRFAISCHYSAVECDYIEVEDTVQKRINDEILEFLNKRFPGISSEMTYADLWRLKAKIVRGIKSSL